MIKVLSIGLLLVLSIIGVWGDYFLKRAGEGGARWSYILIGVLMFALTAFGWFVVYKNIKISSAGFLYGISTSILLLLVGLSFFGEKVNGYEILGIIFAVASFILLARFA